MIWPKSEEVENIPFNPEDRLIFHPGYEEDDGAPFFCNYNKIDDCFMCNWKAPKIREGWGRFKSFYEIEWYYPGYHVIDTSRSLVKMIYNACQENSETHWPGCDCISYLIQDLRLESSQDAPLTKAEKLLFSTLLPVGLSKFMETSYMERSLPERCYPDEPRVINNPLFYQDANTPFGRLVEIAEECGRIWALDRAKPIASANILAEEIALLCHALTTPHRIQEVKAALLPTIAEQMENYKLAPNFFNPY